MKVWHLLGLLLLLTGTACKNKNNFVDPDRKRSFLHVVNGADDSPTFDISINYFNVNNLVIADFFYNRNWPISGYADLEEGGEADEFGHGKLWITALIDTNSSTIPDDTVMMPREIKLEADQKSTLCFADSSGKLVIVKFEDEFTAPDDTFALLRFINLKQDVPAATLKSGDGVIQLQDISSFAASTYMAVPRGNYSIEVNDGSTVLFTDPDVDILEGQVYTFYLSGRPGVHNLDYFIH